MFALNAFALKLTQGADRNLVRQKYAFVEDLSKLTSAYNYLYATTYLGFDRQLHLILSYHFCFDCTIILVPSRCRKNSFIIHGKLFKFRYALKVY